MRALGITNAKGELTTVDAQGHFDIGALEKRINEYSVAHPKDTLGTLHAAFGTRGERIAAIYTGAETMGRRDRFFQAVQSSPTSSEIQGMLSNAPLQQFEQMLARVADIGNTLATATLGPLNDAMKTLNASLTSINDYLKQHPAAAQAGGWGLAGVGVAALTGLGRGAFRQVQRLVTPGVASHAAGGVGVGIGGALRGAGYGLLAGLMIDDFDDYSKGQKVHDALGGALAGGDKAMSIMHSRAGANSQNVTVNLGGITLNGVGENIEAITNKVTQAVSDLLHRVMGNASGAGAGAAQSPAVGGVWTP